MSSGAGSRSSNSCEPEGMAAKASKKETNNDCPQSDSTVPLNKGSENEEPEQLEGDNAVQNETGTEEIDEQEAIVAANNGDEREELSREELDLPDIEDIGNNYYFITEEVDVPIFPVFAEEEWDPEEVERSAQENFVIQYLP